MTRVRDCFDVLAMSGPPASSAQESWPETFDESMNFFNGPSDGLLSIDDSSLTDSVFESYFDKERYCTYNSDFFVFN